jgi:hypothetical protein
MSGAPPSRSSLPSLSGEPSVRRLGVGGGGGGDRPVRAQIVVALVVVLTLVAVPLYLMRKPSVSPKAVPDAGAESAPAPLVSSRPVETADAGKPPERLKLGAPQRVRCGASSRGRQEGSLCDQLAVMEDVLAKAIRDSEPCAPKVKQAGSINYVLTVDFDQRKLHVFPGASGDFRGPQARRAAACVKRALTRPDWDAVRHQYRHYSIAILATYLPESAVLPVPGAPPKFD